MGNTPHNENPDRGSIQLQAGLGRPAIYKKRPVVDAALGLRDLGRRTIHKKEDAAPGLRKGRGLRVEIRIHIQPRQKRKKRQEKHL
ncbi:MAG: hypothetical protein ACQESL_00655 [Bacteroidota bacterium]